MREHLLKHRFTTMILPVALVVAMTGCVWGNGSREPRIDEYELKQVFPNEQRTLTDRVAFIVGGDLNIVDADGVDVIYTDSAYGVAWSPGGDALLVNLKQPGSNPLYDLVIISGSDRSNWEYVQKNIVIPFENLEMDWSPDGDRIVFVGSPPDYEISDGSRVYKLGVDGVYVVDRDGTNRRLVARCADCCEPVWSPDGTYVAFIEPKRGVEIVEPDKPDSRRPVYEFSTAKSTGCYGKNVDWFPDSQRLLISDGLMIRILSLADDSVSTLFEIDPSIAKGYLWAIVLPDGEHIVYRADYQELACDAGLACFHRELMLANLDDMVWRDITPDIDDRFALSYLDWWQAP